MDIRTCELIIALALIIFGAIMVFNDKHYSKTAPGAKVSEHLAKIQGKIAIAGGTIFLLDWILHLYR
jgi:hypothetical protein